MGTNFYIKQPDMIDADFSHIGKSSHGWCFCLRVYPEYGINSLDDWLPILMTHSIEDEYGQKVTIGELLSVIVCREGRPLTPNELSRIGNDFEVGPNNLIRPTIDHECVVGHGDGTFSYIHGEFD